MLYRRSSRWPGQCKVGIVARYRYTPTYKFDVSSAGPGAIRRASCLWRRLALHFRCGRERASLTVSFLITLSDKEQSVRAHSFVSGSARSRSGSVLTERYGARGIRAEFGATMKLTKQKREELRMQFGGGCAFCGSELPARGWHAERIGEDCVSGGLVAVCSECRSSRGNTSPEAFRLLLSEQVERAQRHSVNFRTALRFGLVSETAAPVVFWFEKYQLRGTGTSRRHASPCVNTAH